MFTFLLKRFYQAVIVMFVISLVAFSIQDNLGDPLRELVGQSVSEAQRQAAGIGQGLIRVAVGLEHLDDIRADLWRGLDTL